jgi:hypothetical protein
MSEIATNTIPTNGDRADWAASALAAFGAGSGEDYTNLCDSDFLLEAGGDLLADLLRLCDRVGVPVRDLLCRALVHWVNEVAEVYELRARRRVFHHPEVRPDET